MKPLLPALTAFALILLSPLTAAEAPAECPSCHRTDTIRPVKYGYPGDRMRKDAREGKIILGGCCEEEDSPEYGCLFCRQTLPPLMSLVKELARRWFLQCNGDRTGEKYTSATTPPGKEAFRFDVSDEICKKFPPEVAWKFIPLASMRQIFPSEIQKELSSLKRPLYLYFWAPDGKTYHPLFEYVSFHLAPPPGIAVRDSQYAILDGSASPKTLMAEYDALIAEYDALTALQTARPTDPRRREYLDFLIENILNRRLLPLLQSVIIPVLHRELPPPNQYSCFSREKDGPDIRFEFIAPQYHVSIIMDKRGGNHPGSAEYRLSEKHSLYGVCSPAEKTEQFQKFWAVLTHRLDQLFKQPSDKK